MKQVRIHGPGDVRLDDVAPPDPGPRDAVVRVVACGICGSDVGYAKIGGVAGPVDAPLPLGHELAGVVARVGSEVRGLAPGTRVVLNPMAGGNRIGNGSAEGGFCRELLVPNAAAGDVLFPIPDDLPFDRAALAEPLGVGVHAVNRAGVAHGERVAIFGAGPIGLMSLAALRDRGIDDVAIVDLSEARLEIARTLGARATIHAGREDVWARLREVHGTGPWLGMPMVGTDVYIEASGSARVLQDILAQSKENARLSVVALHRDEIPVSFLMVLSKQLTIVGALAYPEDYGQMIEMLARIDLGAVITHRFPLEDFHAALAVAQDPAAGAKVLIEISPE
ncbi:MAG: zinc-binding dehydrogenase [Deltaproteobacteria bacterium]|nr:zinc-binding dehydrogenase [Deltaproteobacteria bacterium]